MSLFDWERCDGASNLNCRHFKLFEPKCATLLLINYAPRDSPCFDAALLGCCDPSTLSLSSADAFMT